MPFVIAKALAIAPTATRLALIPQFAHPRHVSSLVVQRAMEVQAALHDLNEQFPLAVLLYSAPLTPFASFWKALGVQAKIAQHALGVLHECAVSASRAREALLTEPMHVWLASGQIPPHRDFVPCPIHPAHS